MAGQAIMALVESGPTAIDGLPSINVFEASAIPGIGSTRRVDAS